MAEQTADPAGGYREERVGDEAEADERESEHERLRPDAAAIRCDELGQEGEEEERRLGIEDVDDRAARERPPERLTLSLDWRLRISPEQLADAEVDEVRGPRVLHDAERHRRGNDHGGQPGGCCGDVNERAEMDPGDRGQPDAATLLGALDDDVEDGRPRN